MRLRSVVPVLAVGLLACTTAPSPTPPAKLLGNPVLDARTALASGDSTFLGLFDPELEIPGLDSTQVHVTQERSIRIFSRHTLGLPPRGWEAQRDSLRVYQAAYNQLIFEARLASASDAT